jgi:crotonobetainyl-CoA:carnitine CoA-transferase CaiB-like acyl-CoA transferase
LRAPITFGGLPKAQDAPPPLLGADTRRILKAAGLSDREIEAAQPKSRSSGA